MFLSSFMSFIGKCCSCRVHQCESVSNFLRPFGFSLWSTFKSINSNMGSLRSLKNICSVSLAEGQGIVRFHPSFRGAASANSGLIQQCCSRWHFLIIYGNICLPVFFVAIILSFFSCGAEQRWRRHRHQQWHPQRQWPRRWQQYLQQQPKQRRGPWGKQQLPEKDSDNGCINISSSSSNNYCKHNKDNDMLVLFGESRTT